MPEPLTRSQVQHVAKLARLALRDEEVQRFGAQLSTVLEHIAMLQRLDVDGVEPMAHPLDLTNRFDDDVPGEAMPLEALLANAPAHEGRYLAVPKVLEDGGGG